MRDIYSPTLYDTSFEYGSVKLADLQREHCTEIYYIGILTKIKNIVIECYNCQMYGHDEKKCFRKIRCANCTERSTKSDCIPTNKTRWANRKEDRQAFYDIYLKKRLGLIHVRVCSNIPSRETKKGHVRTR
uniref:CCHC-type domain-containing protein n=1 Tax=Glossina pallidipes TaxID=7398 RepID=A0A1B0ACI6_GLOPL